MRFFEGIIPTSVEKQSSLQSLNSKSTDDDSHLIKFKQRLAFNNHRDSIYSKLKQLTEESLSGRAPAESSLEKQYGHFRDCSDTEVGANEAFRFNIMSKNFNGGIDSADLRFMAGRITSEFLAADPHIDHIASSNLDGLFSYNGVGDELRIRAGGMNYGNWWELSLEIEKLYAKYGESVPITVAMGKNSMKGKLLLKIDNRGPSPSGFISSRRRDWSRTDRGSAFFTGLNYILGDFQERRREARIYELTNQSALLGRGLFNEVYGALFPYITVEGQQPSGEFDKLMGGRNPEETILSFQLSEASNPTRKVGLKLSRCRNCNFPISLKFTNQSLWEMGFSQDDKTSAPFKAAKLATAYLVLGHASYVYCKE